jgi:hypothetical protein
MSDRALWTSARTACTAESVVVTGVSIRLVLPVVICSSAAACDVDGGGGWLTMVVVISPANAESASMRVKTDAAQSCRKVLIRVSSKAILVFEP